MAGLLDLFGGEEEQDPNQPFTDAPQKTGLLGLFDTDQSTNLMMLSSILGNLAWGKPNDLAGTMMQTNMLRERRAKLARKNEQRQRYADKLRASGHHAEADLIEANPDAFDTIIGKKADALFDPQDQFWASLMGTGGGSGGGTQVAGYEPASGGTGDWNPEMKARIIQRSGLENVNDAEFAVLASGAAAGATGFSSAVKSIIDDRRQQSVIDEKAAKDEADLASVEPYLAELEKTNPSMAAALRRNVPQALDYARDQELLQKDPSYVSFKSVFDGVDPNNITPEDIEIIKKRTGLKNVDEGTIRRLYSGGWKNYSQIENQIIDEENKREADRLADERHKAEQAQQDRNFKITTTGKLQDDYDKLNKGYQKAIDVGYRTQEFLKNPVGGGAEQMQILYDFIKNLDSDSAVREGETALARQVASYLDQAKMYIQKVDQSAIAPEEAVKQMAQQIMSITRFAEQGQFRLQAKFSERANAAGVDPKAIFGPADEDIDMEGFETRFPEEPDPNNPKPETPKIELTPEETAEGWTIVNGVKVRKKKKVTP